LNDRKIIGCRKNILSIFVALLEFYKFIIKKKRRKYHILFIYDLSNILEWYNINFQMYIIKNIVAKTGYLRSGMAKYCYKFPNTISEIYYTKTFKTCINLNQY
jgi:hypothetical protein